MRGFYKCALSATLVLGFISGLHSQDYVYFSDSEGLEEFAPRQQRQQQRPQNSAFFQGGNNNFFRQTSASASASASAGSSSASASAGGGNFPSSPGGGAINASLQAQFREIFDWNKNLVEDPRFGGCTVPDIGDVERACPKRAFYFGLNPQHRMAVGMVKQILTGPHNAERTVCLAGRLRDLPGMNPNVWIRGMLGAHLSDVGLFDLEVPPMVEVMPHIFLSRESLQDAKRQGNQSASSRRCTRVDGSVGRDNGIENVLWYFREDVQVNSFHLNWHLIYPFTGITRKANRQGELFYFSHHSHLARYHAERLSNGLGKVVPVSLELNSPVPGGYNPHLDDTNSASSWTPRRHNSKIQDTVFINITGVPPNISAADRSLHVRRVEDSILNRRLRLQTGGFMPLDSRTGIDVLGDVIEASIFTPNGEYYGNFGFHNEGHVLLSLIEDPQNRSGLPPGVMLEVATSMRDPVFYTYHASMDETFDLHKQQLPPYELENGELPLKWEGIEISSVEVTPERGVSNRLTTFLNQRTFELSRGLDFNRSGVQGAISACVTHLDHNPFTYQIYANRQQYASSGRATVRIFMAPRFDENRRKYTILEQRKLFFMLDLFTVQLQPGRNRIQRRSTDSALTIDIPQSLSQIQQSRPDKIKERPRTYCGCGWPHHLLIPKGNERGLEFDIFIMLTNGDEDYVAPLNNPRRAGGECKPAPIYCGRLNDTYPDARPMGYPWDRLPYNAPTNWWERPRSVETLEEYISNIPNAAVVQVTITHTGPNAAVGQQPQNSIVFEQPAAPAGNQNFAAQQPSSSFGQPFNSFESSNGNPSISSNIQQGLGNYPSSFNNPSTDNTGQVMDTPLETVPLVHQEHELFQNRRDYPSSANANAGYVDHDHNHGSSSYYNFNNKRGLTYSPTPEQQERNYHQNTFQRYLNSAYFFRNFNHNYGK